MSSSEQYFVAVDSDGCAFDTMELKHRECFIPAFIDHFALAPIARVARDVAEFVNLRSADRGVNRFPAYLKVLDMLASHPEVVRRGFLVADRPGLRAWIARHPTLSNVALASEIARNGHPDLALALSWSEEVNRRIASLVRAVPPFRFVRESLESLRGKAEVMVVSATPGDALRREWAEHRLSGLVEEIAGQEAGSKSTVLSLAVAGRFDPSRCLMIGDAPGDLHASKSSGILFYPIDPGAEEASWRQFHDEALGRFLDGTYSGAYMENRVARFLSMLPDSPPWLG